MKFDIVLSANSIPQIQAVAHTAESLGCDGLWVPETIHDPFLQLTLVSAATNTIQLGTAIAVAFARSPMHMAYVSWDLARYSQGRFILGLGTQIKPHIERRFAMPWSHPVARFREYIMALRHIWGIWQGGGKLNFRGEFYKMTLMAPFFDPGPIPYPDIPIYIAGVNQGLCALAGELCQGFHVHPFHTVSYLRDRIRPWLQAGAERAGRTIDAMELSTTVFVIAGDDDEERQHQRQRVRQQISFYAATPSYQPVLDQHGWGEIGRQLGPMAIRQKWDEMAALISDEMLAEFAVEGTWDEIGTLIYGRYKGLLDRVTLYLPFVPGKDDDTWRRAMRGLRTAAAQPH